MPASRGRREALANGLYHDTCKLWTQYARGGRQPGRAGSTHSEVNATFEDAFVAAIFNREKLKEVIKSLIRSLAEMARLQDLQPSRIGSHSNLLQVPRPPISIACNPFGGPAAEEEGQRRFSMNTLSTRRTLARLAGSIAIAAAIAGAPAVGSERDGAVCRPPLPPARIAAPSTILLALGTEVAGSAQHALPARSVRIAARRNRATVRVGGSRSGGAMLRYGGQI